MKTRDWSFEVFLVYAVILRSAECNISAWSKPIISAPSGNGALAETINDCVTTGTATGITITATGTSIRAYTKVSQSPATPALAIGSQGVVTVTSGTVSYASVTSFTLVVTANDTDSTATATVTLKVNAAPAIAPHIRSVCLQDSSAQAVKLIDLTATDANSGTSITWAIASGNTDTAFAITSAGSIAVATGKTLHMATTASYTLVITAADDSSTPLTATTTLTATVQTTCPSSSTSASANLTASAKTTCPNSKPAPTTITASIQTTRSNKAASVAISLVTVLTAFLVKGLC